jgi:aldose 1-epimerase
LHGSGLLATAARVTATQPAVLERTEFGRTADGRAVEAITLSNARGMRVRVLTYGATIQLLDVPDRHGQVADVVLGYADLAGYLSGTAYFGSTVGRYANRIAAARFTLGGEEHRLGANDGPHHLHGGEAGFNARLWDVEVAESGEVGRLVLAYRSPDGEEGYPGALEVRATFTLGSANELAIDYEARADQATIVNLTGHSYFNLAGEGASTILDHVLTIPADACTPSDAALIPTGELRPVDGTPFDFRQPRRIGERIRLADEQLLNGRGYDHNWVLAREPSPQPRLAARLEEPVSGRVLEVWSNQPGLQFYSGNFLDGSDIGKTGRAYRQGDGLCLEPQLFPDTPNRPEFGSTRLDAGDTYRHRILYRFLTG